jgi:DNA-binding NtrC family response regulator
MKFKILIIDDEQNIREIFSLLLKEQGYEVETAENAAIGLEKIISFKPDLLLLDMNLPDISGIEVLGQVKVLHPETEVIIITAFGTIKNAVEATRQGAYDYLEKPIDNDELLLLISRVLKVKKLQREVDELKSKLSSQYRFSNIVGRSAKMNSIFQMMDKIARVDGTVLITGESGTGKELAARAIHFNSPRKDCSFVVVNCGAIPKELIESEFFGHTRGAFTDAKTEKIGKFELAEKGTIFLDEIGDLSSEAQVKLLRALGEKEITRVGGTQTIPVDVRVITATNKDLAAEVKSGHFREDLYWRLAVLSLHLPPLRERKEDIPLLCEHFIQKFNQELSKNIHGLSEPALQCMQAYAWPGNIRELESVIYEAMVMSEHKLIELDILPQRLKISSKWEIPEPSLSDLGLSETIRIYTEKIEKQIIKKALAETGQNQTKAAEKLGISRKTLFNKISLYNIEVGKSGKG